MRTGLRWWSLNRRVPLDGTWQTPASIYHETWGYRSWQKRDDLPGKIRDLVVGLTSVRARGGNDLLNIGPRGDGSVVEFEADVLRGIGDWLRRHPGAVLGAAATKFGGQPWGEATVNGKDLYLHVTRWPAAGELRLPGLATDVLRVAEDGAGELAWRRDGDDLIVRLPAQPKDNVLSVVKVELAGELMIVPPGSITADQAWQLSAADFDQGYSYADSGSYPSTWRTIVRQTAHLLTGRTNVGYAMFRGQAEKDSRYRVSLGNDSREVSGTDLMSTAIGPFVVRPWQVTPLTITKAAPAHQGEDLGVKVDAAVVVPSDTVVGWLEAPRQLEIGVLGQVRVHVTNLARAGVSGTAAIRSGWPAGEPVPFVNLLPGRTFTATSSSPRRREQSRATSPLLLPSRPRLAC